MKKCDKCGRDVPLDNDAFTFAAYRHADPAYLLIPSGRHLLPIVEDGNQVCEGSPSIAQYLEGQPKDTRPERVLWPYKPEREESIRKQYAEFQYELSRHMTRN